MLSFKKIVLTSAKLQMDKRLITFLWVMETWQAV